MNNPVGTSISWQPRYRLSWIIGTSERRTRFRGDAQWSKRTLGKSGSDLPKILPEIWPKTSHVAPIRKSIILKKIVASFRRGLRYPYTSKEFLNLFYLGKRISLPSLKVPTKKDIFNTCSVLCTHTSTPVRYTQNIDSNSGEGELDTRDLEMSQF